jgi:long-chain acyl-CoA synthetase
MLLGPSGKNIFPEEIEAVINNMDYVSESLVLMEDNKLIGLIFPDFEMLKKNNIPEEKLPEMLEEIRKAANEKIPEFMQVSKFRVHSEEFAKTPKRSIRRFLYTKE